MASINQGGSLLQSDLMPDDHNAPFNPLIHDKADDSPELAANYENFKLTDLSRSLMNMSGFGMDMVGGGSTNCACKNRGFFTQKNLTMILVLILVYFYLFK